MSSLRGAVSIARRLQDPLAELVKIEPKAIGVGQYQHDVDQTLLARSLDAVVEDCVNLVGVDVNTASAAIAGARVGSQSDVGRKHRRFPRRTRCLQDTNLPQEGAAAWAQSLRTGRRLPAHHERQEPVGCLGGAPGGLSRWWKRLRRRPSAGCNALIGDGVFLKSLEASDVRRRRFRGCRPLATC